MIRGYSHVSEYSKPSIVCEAATSKWGAAICQAFCIRWLFPAARGELNYTRDPEFLTYLRYACRVFILLTSCRNTEQGSQPCAGLSSTCKSHCFPRHSLSYALLLALRMLSFRHDSDSRTNLTTSVANSLGPCQYLSDSQLKDIPSHPLSPSGQ